MTCSDTRLHFRDVPAPLPLPLLQLALRRIVCGAARNHPELFNRLGAHKSKIYLIDPLNLPFVFILCPDPEKLRLRACRRSGAIAHDARIAGSFLSLLDMIDGNLDGDAMFFSRDLLIEGDTEAVVVLRNALDDLDGSIAGDIASLFGPPGRFMLAALRRLRNSHAGK